MKALKLILLFLISHVSNFLLAQVKLDNSTIEAGWGNLNYSVPESPAFKLLDVSPDNIMRPTSTRSIAFSIANSYLTNGATIPKNIAVEIAPSLFNPKVSLEKYNKNRLWYTSTFSVGTKANDNGSYAIATGLKFKLIDKADLRLNGILNYKISEVFGPSSVQAFTDAKIEVDNEDPDLDLIGITNAYSNTADVNHERIKKAVDEKMNSKFDLKKISEFRDEIKNKLWNAYVWDIGVASLFPSKDSYLKNLSAPSDLGIWTTMGFPISKKGQLLIGINGKLTDDLNKKSNKKVLNLGSRLYYGKNDFKGFIQGETNFKDALKPSYNANIGLEATIFNGVWITFNLGFKKLPDQNAIFTPGFNLFFGSAERK